MLKYKNPVDKRSLVCDHCKRTGHTIESCFKIHGTPDWFKELAEKKNKGVGKGKVFAGAVEGSTLQGPDLSVLLRNEIRRLLIEDTPQQHQPRTPLDNIRTNCMHPLALFLPRHPPQMLIRLLLKSFPPLLLLTSVLHQFPLIHLYSLLLLTLSAGPLDRPLSLLG
ncbi:hypothetical protein Salat_1196000 [Sesamum alatum]|uniref:Uncharacterized protein n=1 Tax=Sesamum alatum TaxID=300844 RepID=A0AAE2CNR5_9LAMI|nr:hypothetical protein Salat_1196000 [Sesamum alatum]